MAAERSCAVPGIVIGQKLYTGFPIFGRRELARDGVARSDSTSGVELVHGTQTPVRQRGRPPRSCRAVSPRRDRTAPKRAQVEPGLTQDHELDLPLGVKAERILVVEDSPHQVRLPGVGKQRFVFARKLPQSTENHRDGVGIGKFGLQQFQQAQEVPGDGRAYDPPQHGQTADPHEQRRDIQVFHTVRHSIRSARRQKVVRLQAPEEPHRLSTPPVSPPDGGRHQSADGQSEEPGRFHVRLPACPGCCFGRRATDGLDDPSSSVTVPASPSTWMVCPFLIRLVATPVPSTAGMPYSRATMELWLKGPPTSVTTAEARAKSGVQAGVVMPATSTLWPHPSEVLRAAEYVRRGRDPSLAGAHAPDGVAFLLVRRRRHHPLEDLEPGVFGE